MTTHSDRAFIKQTLALSGYWQINKSIARQIGIIPTLLLQHFIDILVNYKNMPDEFYQQQERIREELSLSDNELRFALKTLKDNNLITVVKRGIPQKSFYTLNFDKIKEMLES